MIEGDQCNPNCSEFSITKGRERFMLPFRYWLDRQIRGFVMFVMRCITPRSADRSVDFQQEKIERILLMRGIFRMGDSILATPAIIIFRERFATAKIDFVGPRVSKILFQNLPMDHHYEVFPGFPKLPLSCIAFCGKFDRRSTTWRWM